MKKITRLLLLLMFASLASCHTQKDFVKNPIKESKHMIPVVYSKQLYNNYKDRFRGPIKNIQDETIERKNYDPTRYVLINIDTLENYIKLLREVEKKNAFTNENNKITGIAVFLGANNMNEKSENKPAFNSVHKKEKGYRLKNQENSGTYNEDIRGRITMFIAPTFRLNSLDNSYSEEQRHVPFYLKPYNKSVAPYIGDYINLLEILEPEGTANKGVSRLLSNQKSNINSLSNDDNETTLILEEFTDMPPRKPVSIKQ